MNNPFTVSLEGIGQCMLHPGLLFCLQPSPHTINYSCPLTTTSSWAGKHWGPSLPQCCSCFKGQKLPATTPASAVSPTQHTHDIQVPRSLACLGCLHYRCQCNCNWQSPAHAAQDEKYPWLTQMLCSTRAAASSASSSAVSTQPWTREKFTLFSFDVLSFPFPMVRWVPHALLILFPFPMLISSWEPDCLLWITSGNCSGIYFHPLFKSEQILQFLITGSGWLLREIPVPE